MPQGGRKKPFSGKAKREQLKEKRERTRSRSIASEGNDDDHKGGRHASRSRKGQQDKPSEEPLLDTLTVDAVAKINAQPNDDLRNRRDANRYALHFSRESTEELLRRKKEAYEPFEVIPREELEVASSDVWPPNNLGMPKRPPWDYKMSVNVLEQQEARHFREYLKSLETEYGSLNNLSHFELNLETWRQLWRVIEMSDVILLVVDIRHPIFHFPPSLYHHVTVECGKRFIIVLNKCDLIPAHLVIAWMDYFSKKYPEIHVVPFASYAGMKVRSVAKAKGKRIGKLRMAAEGSKRLYSVCEKIVGDKVDITSWHEKIEKELKEEEEELNAEDDEKDLKAVTNAAKVTEKRDLTYFKAESFKDGIITIGCVGHPNVGKSSVLNAIMGRKVVSVSRTPGHTKYFQTIFITPTVKLVDCPGLVFPSKIPRGMQVLMGCFPIAQLREPFSAIQFIAQRLDIPKILNLQHPESKGDSWSAIDICEAWAMNRGFKTAKAGRADTGRAANHLLRMALDGRTLCLAFYPENFVRDESIWKQHPDIPIILTLQCQNSGDSEEYLRLLESEEDWHDGGDEKPRSREESDNDEKTSACSTVNRFTLLGDE